MERGIFGWDGKNSGMLFGNVDGIWTLVMNTVHAWRDGYSTFN